MEVSVCVTDADYEAWRGVRLAVQPGERCDTVAELREQDSPERVLMLARVDGEVVGSGLADRSDTAGGGFIAPRVLPERRRRGIGAALLTALARHCEDLDLPLVLAHADEPGSLAFAQRFGFVEVDREVEQTRGVGDEPLPTSLPPDLEVVDLAAQPDLWNACFDTFGREALEDFAVHTPLDISAEHWATSWRGDPVFLALHEGQVMGCAGLFLDTDVPTRAENALTAVRRDWRGRGIAVHLKRRTLHWAAGHGITEVYTWTQVGNTAMIRLNEHLGYVTTRTSSTLSRPLPLTPVEAP